MKNHKKSFSASEAIIIVVVVAIAAFIGWYMWQAKSGGAIRQTTNSSSAAATKQPARPDAAAYLNIIQYNVRLPLDDKTAGLKLGTAHASSYSSSDKSIPILAPELSGSWKCTADEFGNKATLGTISVTASGLRAGPGRPLAAKKVDNYTYGFEAAGDNCTDSGLYRELVEALKAQFNGLQAY